MLHYKTLPFDVQLILIIIVKSSCLFVLVVKTKKKKQFKDGLLKEDVPGM